MTNNKIKIILIFIVLLTFAGIINYIIYPEDVSEADDDNNYYSFNKANNNDKKNNYKNKNNNEKDKIE